MKTKHTPKGWSSMSKAQKRVAVAKDVLAQIDAEMVVAEECVYVEARALESEMAQQYCDVSKPVVCRACGLGSLILSSVRFENERTVSEINGIDGYEARAILSHIFKDSQLDLIESAFERTSMADTNCSVDCAVSFGADFWHSEDRLIAIMQNIIDHKGRFVPSVRYNVV